MTGTLLTQKLKSVISCRMVMIVKPREIESIPSYCLNSLFYHLRIIVMIPMLNYNDFAGSISNFFAELNN